jgi:hypothetical protein
MAYYENIYEHPISWTQKAGPVFRMLDNREHIDRFFAEGELRISSFDHFRNHKDEKRLDREDGRGIVASYAEGATTKITMFDSGVNAYVLCTATTTEDRVRQEFGAVGCIKIHDPRVFGISVALKLPFARAGIEGHCDYAESKIEWLDSMTREGKQYRAIDFENDPEAAAKFQAVTASKELFLKHTSFQHQREHRFLWFSNRPVTGYTTVRCPEAISVCERIDF